MKRTLKYALTAVLGAAIITPALAQDNFPDVPDNHWAYEALLRMKSNGLLVGYPDGLFRGARPASRYEMAVAIHATYVNLKNITDGLQKQIDDLKGQVGGRTTGGGDTQNLKTALENLQAEVSGMKKWGDDVAALRRLTDTFQKELQDLNVDVEKMKADLKDLADRVERLEKVKPAVTISGDANLWVGTGGGLSSSGGLNKDGRYVGARVNAGAVSGTSFFQDLTILHEGAFTFTTTNETGPKASATLVAGNMLGAANAASGSFYSQGLPAQGTFYREAVGDVYFQDFSVKFDSAVAGLGFNAEIGRVGYKISPMILQRPDFTTYFYNDRWDDGKYRFDGGIVSLGLGKAKVDIFGGRTNRRFSNNGVELNPQLFGPLSNPLAFSPDRTLGANVGFGIGDMGSVNVAYLLFDANTPVALGLTNYNRVEVLGGDANLTFGKIKVAGGYAQSNLKRNNKSRQNSDNTAFYGKASYMGNNFGVTLGYKQVERNYVAPGDWGRLGIDRNPNNIRGFYGNGHLNLGDNLTLRAGAAVLEGNETVGGAPAGSYSRNTDITRFDIGLDYKLSENFTLMLGAEQTEFKNVVGVAGKPQYRWYNVGFGYGLSSTSMLKIGYEVSDIKNDFQTVGFAATSPVGRYQGGFFTTQLSVKF
jgi:hypothetical protein